MCCHESMINLCQTGIAAKWRKWRGMPSSHDAREREVTWDNERVAEFMGKRFRKKTRGFLYERDVKSAWTGDKSVEVDESAGKSNESLIKMVGVKGRWKLEKTASDKHTTHIYSCVERSLWRRRLPSRYLRGLPCKKSAKVSTGDPQGWKTATGRGALKTVWSICTTSLSELTTCREVRVALNSFFNGLCETL